MEPIYSTEGSTKAHTTMSLACSSCRKPVTVTYDLDVVQDEFEFWKTVKCHSCRVANRKQGAR